MKLYSKSVSDWEKPPERLLADDGTAIDEYASSRPHDTLLLYERGAPPQRDVWLVDLREKQKAKPLIADPKFDEWMASFSPDGRLIAYLSNETGIQEAWVRSLDSPASTIMVSSGGASSPVWSPSGSELFFLAQTNMLSARILAQPTLRSEKARTLFPVPTPMFKRRFDISPDGKRFVVVRGGSATSGEVTVIMNWLKELQKRVPLKGTGSE